jgi:hypothetical protein
VAHFLWASLVPSLRQPNSFSLKEAAIARARIIDWQSVFRDVYPARRVRLAKAQRVFFGQVNYLTEPRGAIVPVAHQQISSEIQSL